MNQLLQLDDRKAAGGSALLDLGFRPFFLGAAGYAVLSVSVWMAVYVFGWTLQPGGLPPVTWHAHEMIYGYTLAVVAGFLLTAIHNWTGRPTLNGFPLFILFMLWAACRIGPLLGDAVPLRWVAAGDVLFDGLLLAAAAWPVVKARQWNQTGVLGIVTLITAGNLVFYLGALHGRPMVVFWALYSGLYLIVALIFKMARRMIPTFIENGVDEPVKLINRQWVDLSSLVLFFLFWIADLVHPNGPAPAALAGLLFAVHGVRLAGWHTPGIWKKPMLWSLYLAYGSLIAGFALKAGVWALGISPYLSVHAFAYGGIGLMTIGMMARVTLGHTGRNVLDPPPLVHPMFVVLLAGAIVRVFGPLAAPSQAGVMIGLSQGLWIVSFTLFIFVFSPMLVRPEVRG